MVIFKFTTTQNSSSARSLTVSASNSGSGTSTVAIIAEDVVDIDASDSNGKVHVEILDSKITTLLRTLATMHLDPNDDRAVSGLVTCSW